MDWTNFNPKPSSLILIEDPFAFLEPALNNLKLIEVETLEENQFRINKITESKLDYSFNTQSIIEREYISNFANNLRNVIDTYGFDESRAVISIPNELVIVKRYLYDLDFTDEEILRKFIAKQIKIDLSGQKLTLQMNTKTPSIVFRSPLTEQDEKDLLTLILLDEIWRLR